MSESWTVNSAYSLAAFNKHVELLYDQHKYITFSAPRIGADRSISQNALFHVWATEYVAWKLNMNNKEVSKGLLAGMKLIIKKRYTAAHPDSVAWMVYEVVNPFNGKSKKDNRPRHIKVCGISNRLRMVRRWRELDALRN